MHAIENPFLEWLGVRLVKWAPGYAEMHLDTAQHFGNRTGRLQGGVMCTLLDAAAGYAGLYSSPDAVRPQSLTLSLTTNFVDSGEGDVLVAKGYVVRKGRSIYFARSEVWLGVSLLAATAVGTFNYVERST